MHLGDGGRAYRLHVELGEQLVGLGAQRIDYHLSNHRRRQRRHPVLQLFELVYPVRRKHVHPGGQDLAQLDEGGPQLLEASLTRTAVGRPDSPSGSDRFSHSPAFSIARGNFSRWANSPSP